MTCVRMNTVKENLVKLAGRFDGFEEELHLSRQKKKQDDDRKIIALQTQINNLRDSLTLESKNRAMSIRALQSVSTILLLIEIYIIYINNNNDNYN